MAIKKIEAIIRREKFEDVKKALTEIGIIGFNVAEIRGRGRGVGVQIQGRTGMYIIDLLPRMQINIILSEHNVEETVNAIKTAAYTGERGDGVIFIYPVDNVVRISTNEQGHDAITYQGDIDARRQDHSDTL
jgi:nitrogen regulatory protein P-II 1